MSILVALACNDPDNGQFTGKVDAISIGCFEMELESTGAPRSLVERNENCIRLCGKNWNILGSVYGYGNWCWNAYWMSNDDAAHFLKWLHSRRLFHCNSAHDEIYEAWNSKQSLTHDWLRWEIIKTINQSKGGQS